MHGTHFKRALKRVLKDGHFDTAELADVAGCTARHIYKCAHEYGAELSLPKAEKIARYLSQHAELRPLQAFDGRDPIDDDVKEQIDQLIETAHKIKDRL
jgi:hypothetical protein